MPVTRTTIIVSDLTREQCLTVPKALRHDIEALSATLGSDLINHWSELSFLSRLVVIINTEENALRVFQYLQAQHPELKSNIHLSESIMRRHGSFDATLTTPASPRLGLYEEKEPVKSDDEDSAEIYTARPPLKKSNTRILLDGLRLDTSKVVMKNGTVSPMSPTITLDPVDLA